MNCLEFDGKVMDWMDREQLLCPGDGVVLGVSGGADSVALLRFFHRIREQKELRLLCVHVEHGLRGAESLGDQEFVRELCRELEIACVTLSLGDRLRKRSEGGKSPEEEARQLRYKLFEEQAEKLEKETGRYVRIAVAHHSEDNAETILFHLARGTGLEGLCGMPIRRGRIIRPFFSLRRKEIEDYLEELGQDYRTDASNADLTYDRNRIRHQILPELQKVNEQAMSHIWQTGMQVRQVMEDIRKRCREILSQAGTDREEIRLESWKDQPDYIKREVIRLWLEDFISEKKNVASCHLYEIVALEQKKVGSRVSLPGCHQVCRTYTGLRFIRKEDQDREEKENPVLQLTRERLESRSGCRITFRGKDMIFRVWEGKEVGEIPRNSYTKWFDYDKIKGGIAIRSRETGDYLMIRTEGGTQKLQDYMVNQKIPAERRDDVILLCDGSHVLWVIGYRISAYYKVQEETRRILEVRILEEEDHE